MIRTYGLFWKVEDVFWGRQNLQGELLGSKTQSAKAVPVDFRDQRGIYALYADYDLVYVGQTGGGKRRLFNCLKGHLSDHLTERWNRFSWFGTQWVTKSHRLSTDTAKVGATVGKALNILEAIVIAVAEPSLNLQRGRWGEAEQYYQFRTPQLEAAPE